MVKSKVEQEAEDNEDLYPLVIGGEWIGGIGLLLNNPADYEFSQADCSNCEYCRAVERKREEIARMKLPQPHKHWYERVFKVFR